MKNFIVFTLFLLITSCNNPPPIINGYPYTLKGCINQGQTSPFDDPSSCGTDTECKDGQGNGGYGVCEIVTRDQVPPELRDLIKKGRFCACRGKFVGHAANIKPNTAVAVMSLPTQTSQAWTVTLARDISMDAINSLYSKGIVSQGELALLSRLIINEVQSNKALKKGYTISQVTLIDWYLRGSLIFGGTKFTAILEGLGEELLENP